MKAKITRGKDFGGLIRYVFDIGAKATGDKKPEVVAGNLTTSRSHTNQIASELKAISGLRPDIDRPAWHCSLSLPPGEHLEGRDWRKVVNDFMVEMEFPEDTPHIAVRHNDKDHDHVHIVASRVGIDSEVWLGQWEALKAIEVTQKLEEKYDLTRVPFIRPERRPLSSRETKKAERTGIEPPRQRLQDLIDEAAADKPTAPEFAQRLTDAGVGVRAHVKSTGRMDGWSFELDGIAFKGSSLGKKYGWKGLQQRGVSYDPDRDQAELERYTSPLAERSPLVEKETTAATRAETTPADHPVESEPATRQPERSLTPKQRLQKLIDQAATDQPTAPEFAQRLQNNGVGVRANIASTGRMSGFSFELDGVAFKGSSLGKAYGWKGLQQRGVSYQPERDQMELERYRQSAGQQSARQSERSPQLSPPESKLQTTQFEKTGQAGQSRKASTPTSEHSTPAPDIPSGIEGEAASLLATYRMAESQIGELHQQLRTVQSELGNVKNLRGNSQSREQQLEEQISSLSASLAEQEKQAAHLKQQLDAARSRPKLKQGQLDVVINSDLGTESQTQEQQGFEAGVGGENLLDGNQVELHQPDGDRPRSSRLESAKPGQPDATAATERSPELTQPSEVDLEQQEYVEVLAPKLADLMNSSDQTSEVDNQNLKLQGTERTLHWENSSKSLILRENDSGREVLSARWNTEEERWQDEGSKLTQQEFESIQRRLVDALRDRDRQEQER